MSIKTLFSAYRACRVRMELTMCVRPKRHFGIGIDSDILAVEYRRRRRLARKIEARFLGDVQ